ncbi:MAG TPA: TraR/DksA C4-type zinc finger protein [Terrimesophilobacter sp.]|nr:TraR/DksA C4-type zinc finger protein [Terrimesophilobacter sp.]HRP99946.1 TraR/DksA C4-type zinc finger protein [Terrimesophilobacter sp.]
MSRLDTDKYRELLLATETETLEEIKDLDEGIAALIDASHNSNHDDEHDPEGVTIAFERSQTDALLTQSTQRLAEVRAALARIDDGTYGDCAVCGGPIGWERLTARPYARTCIEHTEG